MHPVDLGERFLPHPLEVSLQSIRPPACPLELELHHSFDPGQVQA
jgi:hypothetical protein